MADKTEKPIEKKMEETKKIVETKPVETAKVDNAKPAEVKQEKKVEQKSATDKPKKTEAITNGVSVRASKRHCMYIGSFIKGKTIDAAISDLNEVIAIRKIVPFKGEIPHRKGKGMMSGRYPVNASIIFIAMLKSLRGNAIVNGMDLDKTRIFSVVSNWASRQRRKNGKAKRANVEIVAKQIDAKEVKK